MKWKHPRHTILSGISLFIWAGLLTYANCGTKGGSGGGGFESKDPFISTWQTTTANEEIKLPLREGYEYNMIVNWGDGTTSKITAWDDEAKIHEYAEIGTYTITIKGIAEAWYFNACDMDPDNHSEEKILTVEDLGDMGWKNLEKAFCGCINLTTFKGGNTSEVTNMEAMFWSAIALEAEINHWNTSKVKNMKQMFDGAHVENMDLRGWDTSSVSNMERMFIAVDGEPILGDWNTSKVTTMRQMFYLSSVNPDMSGWNFASITDMSQMLVGQCLRRATIRTFWFVFTKHEQTTMSV
ncbi:MAG: BspA family leucine-rich repeat surface protein [Bdellovibrionota bacterium]